MFLWLFRLRTMRTRGIRVLYLMAAHSIRPGSGPACWYRKQVGHRCTSQPLQTRIHLPRYCTSTQDSTENITWWLSCIQFCSWAYYCRRTSLCCSVKGSRSNDRRIDSSCCCRRTLRLDTFHAENKPIFWLKVCDVAVRSCKDDMTTYMSSRALVARLLRCCMAFGAILLNQSNPYSHNNRWKYNIGEG